MMKGIQGEERLLKGAALMAVVIGSVQVLVVLSQWSHWPLSNFDMFAQPAPEEAIGYRLVFKGHKPEESFEKTDFSKVSFEIYNRLSLLEPSPGLDQFILKQASLYVPRSPFKIKNVQLVQFRVSIDEETGELSQKKTVIRELPLERSAL